MAGCSFYLDIKIDQVKKLWIVASTPLSGKMDELSSESRASMSEISTIEASASSLTSLELVNKGWFLPSNSVIKGSSGEEASVNLGPAKKKD